MLDEKSRVALTLRTVCHLTTREVAAAFLDKDITMGQRISRAKDKLREARVTFEIPDQEVWPARLDSVLSTIYLIFTTGYVSEDNSDRDLCVEAIFLLRLLDRLSSDDPEIEGALALALLTDSRRKARIGEDGATVPPESQNRELWDVRAMQEGRETPVVALNWAVAIAEVGQEELALHKVEDLKSELETFQPFHAAYANILSKVGRQGEARNAYDKAIELAQNEASRTFLIERRDRLGYM